MESTYLTFKILNTHTDRPDSWRSIHCTVYNSFKLSVQPMYIGESHHPLSGVYTIDKSYRYKININICWQSAMYTTIQSKLEVTTMQGFYSLSYQYYKTILCFLLFLVFQKMILLFENDEKDYRNYNWRGICVLCGLQLQKRKMWLKIE